MQYALERSSKLVQELYHETHNPFWLLLSDLNEDDFRHLVDYLASLEVESDSETL